MMTSFDSENEEYIDDPTTDISTTNNNLETYQGKTITTTIDIKPRLRAGKDRTKWHLITMKETKELCDKLTQIWIDSEKKDWIALRDACMLAILICFGKRASEIVNLKCQDIIYEEGDDGYCKVSFTVLKKMKAPKKRCPSCGKLKRFKAVVCDEDKTSLENAEIVKLNDLSGPVVSTKALKMTDPMVRYINRWHWNFTTKYNQKGIGYLFPPSESSQKYAPPILHKHLDRRSIKNIFESRGISDYWPHLFRASAATALANQLMKEGKDPMQIILERFDWVREDTARIYIEMGKNTRDERLASDTMSRIE